MATDSPTSDGFPRIKIVLWTTTETLDAMARPVLLWRTCTIQTMRKSREGVRESGMRDERQRVW